MASDEWREKRGRAKTISLASQLSLGLSRKPLDGERAKEIPRAQRSISSGFEESIGYFTPLSPIISPTVRFSADYIPFWREIRCLWAISRTRVRSFGRPKASIKKGIMGRYSYSQPSQSASFGGDGADSGYSEIEALIREDQAELSYAEEMARTVVVYPPQPEVEFGFPQTCYCGSKPEIGTSYNRTDPGRRFYTCRNVDDGECHVWKWWDEAVMEEMRASNRQTLQLAEKVDSLNFLNDFETDQKINRLEKMVAELAKNKSSFTLEYFVAVMVIVLVFIGIVLIYI